MCLITDAKYDVRALRLGLRGKLRGDYASPTGGPLQAAQSQGRGCARVWRRLLGVVLPPLARDVQPELRLFEYLAHDNHTLQINLASGVNPKHLNCFKSNGRVLGLAVFHHRVLNANFVQVFYKMVLNKK